MAIENCIKNSANYKKGGQYHFKVKGVDQLVVILDKGNKQMQLKLPDGSIGWFAWVDLIHVDKDKRPTEAKTRTIKNPPKPRPFNPVEIKPAAKNPAKIIQVPMSEEPQHKDVMVLNEKSAAELARNYKLHLKNLRLMLFNKGYKEVYQLNPAQIRNLIKENLPDKVEK